MNLKQHASGDFVCQPVAGTPHCGKDDGTGHFRFCVDVVYSGAAALDDHGFLLDNLDFQAYFDGIKTVSVSCERLAIDACEHFKSLLGARCRYVEEISVKVYPFGDVFVEADETAPEVST